MKLLHLGLIVVIILLVGWIAWPYIQQGTQQASVGTGTVVECAEFTITPSVSSSEATLNSDETVFTIAAYANTTAHTITENDNTTWVNPVLSFTIKPDMGTFSKIDADDLAVIYYEVTNPEVTTDDGTDTYKLFTKSSGKRQVIWSGDGTEYVSGSSKMLFTENQTLTLTLTCSQDSYSRMENTYDPIRVYIKFYNNCGWSETFYAEFMLVHTYT